MYVCPLCKGTLIDGSCGPCGFSTDLHARAPVFFSGSPLSQRYRAIGEYYDDLYDSRTNVWEDYADRGPDSIAFMARLVEEVRPRRYLDVGCGQGYLLDAVSGPEKFGTDISRRALETTGQRTDASLCIGIVEELPYPDGFFDVVSGIGVMEHMIDDMSATREINRVLRPGGRYIVLLLTDRMLLERIRVKLGEFVYPRPKPRELLRWAWSRLRSGNRDSSPTSDDMPMQPVQNRYSPKSAEARFASSGFRVERSITKRLVPDAPLPGHYMRLYVLAKSEEARPAARVSS
jgi:SAM-dependent methyltransferase